MENLANNFPVEDLRGVDYKITFINPRFYNMENAKELVYGEDVVKKKRLFLKRLTKFLKKTKSK